MEPIKDRAKRAATNGDLEVLKELITHKKYDVETGNHTQSDTEVLIQSETAFFCKTISSPTDIKINNNLKNKAYFEKYYKIKCV